MIKFLTLKHWQLFILLMGLPIIFHFVTMVFAFRIGSTPGADITYDMENLNLVFKTGAILTIFIMGIFFGWFYALGTNLHKRLPLSAPMNLKRFKIFMLIPAVYTIIFSSVFMYMTFYKPNLVIFLVIFPLHLYCMFCIFYCLHFIAKALKAVEVQRPVTFSDFAGEFFLIWFFPLGVWIIQPRINKLFVPTIAPDGNEILDHNV